MPGEPPERNTDLLKPSRAAGPMQDRGPRPAQATPPWRLLLQIGGENRTTIGIPVTEQMLVGREDSEGQVQPEIDLAPYDALRNGVSRRHAIITYDDGTLYIEDLNSTNGTRINGYQLTPDQQYRLRDGDEVEFGRIRVVIRFVRASR